LGLQFSLPDGEEWRTAMIDLLVFPFKDPQAFYDNLVAQRDPNTHKPDPAKGAAFLASHPETARARNHQEPFAVVRFRQRRLLQPQCVPIRQRGGYVHLRALDARARAAL
jgi:hypothetical protein